MISAKKFMLLLDKIRALLYYCIEKNRVAKVRKVLQNGMSFANERIFPAVLLRVRYY